ncbi:hypothetical protein ACWCPI_00830 [Streptomyces sp. NPDC001920]
MTATPSAGPARSTAARGGARPGSRTAAGCVVVVGIGSGLSDPPLSHAVLTSVPAHQAGVGSGVNSFSREIGGALGFAVFGTLLNIRFADALPAGLRHLKDDSAGGQALGTALREAGHPGSGDGARLAAQVREAFSTGMAESLRVIGVRLLAALLVIAWLRPYDAHRNTSREKH